MPINFLKAIIKDTPPLTLGHSENKYHRFYFFDGRGENIRCFNCSEGYLKPQ